MDVRALRKVSQDVVGADPIALVGRKRHPMGQAQDVGAVAHSRSNGRCRLCFRAEPSGGLQLGNDTARGNGGLVRAFDFFAARHEEEPPRQGKR